MLSIILAATLAVSLLSLVGLLFIGLSQEKLGKILEYLVSFAVGELLGGAFLHLLPEAVEKAPRYVFSYALIGILSFLIIEKFLHWRHCHIGRCDAHAFTYLNLFGDGVHNLIDGMIIAASFLTDFRLGVATTRRSRS